MQRGHHLLLAFPLILAGCGNSSIPGTTAQISGATTNAPSSVGKIVGTQPFVGKWRKETEGKDYILELEQNGSYSYEEVRWKDKQKTKRLSNQFVTGNWSVQNNQAVFILPDTLAGNTLNRTVRATLLDGERSKLGFDAKLKINFNVASGGNGETVLTKISGS